jgi:hypothetical protein
MKLRLALTLFAAVLLSAGARPAATANDDIAAAGAFICDFGLPGDMPFDQVPAILERDRQSMAARPGFIRKLVPLRIDPFTGDLSSGGRYLFETKQDAEAYQQWVTEEFALDGVLFFDRPYFLQPDCRAWEVIGAHDFGDIHASHIVIRTERWSVSSDNQRKLLKDRWPAVRAAAEARGLSSVWLLYDKKGDVVSLVYTADRIAPPDPYVPDFASLLALEFAPPLGALFDDQPWNRVFDRTHWTLTIWFPFHGGDSGEPSLWPNSPPFPRPSGG